MVGPSDKLLAEWFWTDRWDGSSAALLPLEARGLYREMLTQAWRRGARLPNDPEAIRRAVRATEEEWARCWPRVEKYWRVDGDALVNDTQVEVFSKSSSLRDHQVAGGLARAAKATRSTGGRFQPAGPAGWSSSSQPGGPAGYQPLSLSPDLSPESGSGSGVCDSSQTRNHSHDETETVSTTKKHSPKEAAARRLAKTLRSSLKVCRDQVSGLCDLGWTIERIESAISGSAKFGMSPWDWTREVNPVAKPASKSAEDAAYIDEKIRRWGGIPS